MDVFGRPIGQLQTIQGYLAQLIMEILGSDTLTMFTAFNMDRGRYVRGYVAKTKGFSAETVARTMDIGSQIFGGMGYMKDLPVEQMYRDVRNHRIAEGTSEILRLVIARDLLKQ